MRSFVRLVRGRHRSRKAGPPFSLLPDCLAAVAAQNAREPEEAVGHAEQSPEGRRPGARTDYVRLPGAMRWLERHVKLVRAALWAVILSLPDELAGCRPELSACRCRSLS